MKNKNFLLSVLCIIANLLIAGCYEDKGNYDYKNIGSVEMTIKNNYTVAMGGSVTLQADIKSDINTDDIRYEWQLFRSSSSEKFITIAEGESVEYSFDNSYFASPGTYYLRMKAVQKSSEREFYSDIFQVRLTGVTGLMVLHDNGQESDIGLIVDKIFLASEGETETQNTPDWYSVRNGKKIKGQGTQIIHLLTDDLPKYYPDRAYVAALTSEEGILADYTGLNYVDEYTKLFYGGLENPRPERFTVYSKQEIFIDNGRLFVCDNVSQTRYYLNSINGIDEESVFSPYVVPFQNYSYSYPCICYDNTNECFVYWDWNQAWTAQECYKISTPGKAFDMAAMNAKLVYMDKGGRLSHYMAVMKTNEGNYYLAEMDFNTSVKTDAPIARYEVSKLTDFNQSLFHAFGDDQINMCYYATAQHVYRYAAENSVLHDAELLKKTDGTTIDFNGEITMMKILKPYRLTANSSTGVSDFSYPGYNKVMLVGTWDGTKGTLYCISLEESTGLATDVSTYEGFNIIRDANIKGI